MTTERRDRIKKWVLGIVVAGTVVLGVLNLMKGSDPKRFVITAPNGHRIVAEVADTPEDQMFRLFFVTEIPENQGFLLLFERPGDYHLTTRNAHFPLDILWINAQRQVIHLEQRVAPCPDDPCPKYGPPEPDALFILEAAAGYAERQGITKGTELQLNLLRSS